MAARGRWSRVGQAQYFQRAWPDRAEPLAPVGAVRGLPAFSWTPVRTVAGVTTSATYYS